MAIYQCAMGAGLIIRGHLDFTLVAESNGAALHIAPRAQASISDADMAFAFLAARYAYLHTVPVDQRDTYDMTADIGPDPIVEIALRVTNDDPHKAAAWVAELDAQAGGYVQIDLDTISTLADFLLTQRAVTGAQALRILESED